MFWKLIMTDWALWLRNVTVSWPQHCQVNALLLVGSTSPWLDTCAPWAPRMCQRRLLRGFSLACFSKECCGRYRTTLSWICQDKYVTPWNNAWNPESGNMSVLVMLVFGSPDDFFRGGTESIRLSPGMKSIYFVQHHTVPNKEISRIWMDLGDWNLKCYHDETWQTCRWR